MQKKYINNKISRSFLERTAPTSYSFLFVYIFFAINRAGDHSNSLTVYYISIGMIFNALIRILVARLFSTRKLNIKNSYWLTILLIITNGVGWSILTYSVLFAEKIDFVGSLLVTLCSFVFLANSIYHLSPVLYLLYFYIVTIMSPIFFKIYFLNKTGDYKNIYSINILLCIYTFYVIKQALKINDEETKLYANEFDLKRNNYKLQMANKEIELHSINSFHNERLTSLGEMSSSIAHEINNPLTIIAGSVQTLLKRPELLDQSVLDKIQKIHFATERIGKIIKTMKMFSSKSETIEKTSVDVSKIIDESLSLCIDRIKTSDIKLIVECEECKANCNMIQISQIILNLINNAIDALNSNSIESKEIKIIAHQSDDYITINSGPKIPFDIRQRLFTPFFTSKSIGKGTGLGLSISKKLAENNNGSLTFSENDNLTTFILMLSSK
jgi:signal transduction histidine kinase